MKKIELLAPAGNMQAFHSAIDNGADAIYLGGKSFSARAFAGNFSEEEIKDCVEYAHLRNVKIYVALNTLLNEYELENAIKQAHYYHDINVDALIIQDLGLYYRITREIPDMEIHASTQMHIHNIQGVINAKKMGFKRVVVARESTQEFISEACKEDIEIEIFAHGAICASYSGQCLISSFSKNRSANKGMCAQCCRLKYKLLDKNK
ncbi:MAG: U32 family peptidase, partial [Erysipelotrichaceae bacterium]|nr:U32 family peptidase [Erysipelotrichaceae bacterium]